jgi:small subunit ribosomal protein S18
MASIDQQAKGGKQGDVRYLTPLDIDTKKEAKYCRFKKNGKNASTQKLMIQ